MRCDSCARFHDRVQITLATIFESMGWRVFRVPETATILLGGGISFALLSDEERLTFQENLLKTMFQLEDTYFNLADTQVYHQSPSLTSRLHV